MAHVIAPSPLIASVLLTFYLLVAVQSTPVKRDTNACHDPSHHELRTLLHPVADLDQLSFEPLFDHTAVSPTTFCPVGSRIHSNDIMLNERTVCPWEYMEDSDDNRIPKVIMKAVCRCQNCLTPLSGLALSDSRCVPIEYTINVLNRTGCVNGVNTYEVVPQNVSVACSCSRPISNTSASST